MNTEFYEYNEEDNLENNYHSSLFESEDIFPKPDCGSIAFSYENLLLPNYPNCQSTIPNINESHSSTLFSDPSKFVEDSKEVNSNQLSGKMNEHPKELVPQEMSNLLPKNQKKQRTNRKPRSYTDNFTKTSTKKKKAKANNIIRISDLLDSIQKPDQIINLEKKKIFKIAKLFQKGKAPSLTNSPVKGENLYLDSETKHTPEKQKCCLVEEEKVDVSIKRKMNDKDNLFDGNPLKKKYVNCNDQSEQKPSNGQLYTGIGYVHSENIKLNFQLEDKLHHMKLMNDDY